MSTQTALEELLRNSAVTNGSISLLRLNGGQWRATVCHHNGHMVHPFDDWEDDPVEALRIALVEDERLCRDLARRYRNAPKIGSERPAPPPIDDMDDLLG